MNLEHVLPENPGPEWSLIDPDMADALYSRIGNMALMQARQNSIVGNSGFQKKKKALKESSYALTKMIADEADWGKAEIDGRQQTLAALAVKTWPLSIR